MCYMTSTSRKFYYLNFFMKERRVPVTWYEWSYEVSNLWRVRSLDRYSTSHQRDSLGNFYTRRVKQTWRMLKQQVNNWGYARVRLMKNGKWKYTMVHRIVYFSFNKVPLAKNNNIGICCICHKDDNRLNNSINNLFYGTYRDNVRDMMKKWRENFFWRNN